MKKKVVLMTSALMAIGLLSGCGHTHEWEITYVWAEDNESCTATMVCKGDGSHVETVKADSTYVVVEAAKCEETGLGRYTVTFEDEMLGTQSKDVVLDATGHSLVAHAAVAETCTEAGNSAYWSCENCDKFFLDAEGKNAIAADGWLIPAHAHTLTNHAAVSETCDTDGNVEYWTCGECDQYFLDANGTQATAAQGVVVAAHHTLNHHAKEDESCTSNGMIEYWECTVCHKDFFDEAATREIESEDDYIIPMHHTLAHHEAAAETCTEAGNVEYWDCSVCGKLFSDASAESETTQAAIVVPAKGHNMAHNDAVAPQCEVAGNAEYWHCSNCEKNFSDSQGNTELEDVVIPATGHNFDPDTVTYVWNGDYSKCTAAGMCQNGTPHEVSETATAEIDCDYDTFISTFTATFEITAFAEQTKEFALPTSYFETDENYLLESVDKNAEAVYVPATYNDKPVIFGNRVIYDMPNLKEIIFDSNSGITELGTMYLYNNPSLTYVSFPSGLTSIGMLCFQDCYSLTSVTFPDNFTTVGEQAFSNCRGLEELTFPATLTSIGQMMLTGCDKIETITFKGTKEQWNAVDKGFRWNNSRELTVHCSDGDVTVGPH